LDTLSENDIVLKTYRIDRMIGQGAFGRVYKATHINLNGVRAIKVLYRNDTGIGSTEYSEYRDRFRQESQLMERLKNPNIIQVFDFQEENDTLFLVMEYAAGGSLKEKMDQYKADGKTFSFDETVKIGLDIASGLSHLHKMDVVHRDLKPSNILFDAAGNARIADLGLAQVPGGASMRSVLSVAKSHPGTPAYMSPEQGKLGSYLGPSSDIYSLGLILFEMVTMRLYKNVRPGSRLSTFIPDAPVWLDELVDQMLAENPKDRPWDGNEAAEKMREYLASSNKVAPGINPRGTFSNREDASVQPEKQGRNEYEFGLNHQNIIIPPTLNNQPGKISHNHEASQPDDNRSLWQKKFKNNLPELKNKWLGRKIIPWMIISLCIIIFVGFLLVSPFSLTGNQRKSANHIFDDFSSNNLKWEVDKDANSEVRIENGEYSIHVIEPYAEKLTFFPVNFRPNQINFDVRGPSGQQNGEFGLKCQYIDEKNYYFIKFDLFDNKYTIAERIDNKVIFLTEQSPSGQFWYPAKPLKSPPTSKNSISITCNLDNISIYVNNSLVDSVKINTPIKTNGTSGFFVYSQNDAYTGYQVWFDNVEISQK
jgi:serine/threonine protein kinase